MSVTPDAREPVSLTVHSMPAPSLEEGKRTSLGRLKMFLVLLVCASPVIASYLTYFVIRPEGRTNYGELVQPQRTIPADLPLTSPEGAPVRVESLRGQWLLVVVGGGACDAGCEHKLWLQRQLRESLGRDKDRIDKVWLIPDGTPPREQTLQAVRAGEAVTVLSVPSAALAGWLEPAAGHRLDEHFYLVDPMGNWMMRMPVDADAAKMKRDIVKLLRASSSWDVAGR